MATTKKQTPEEQALALTSDGIFRQFESVVPEGATTVHVLEAAATLIANSLVQMNATRQDLHNVMAHLEEYAAKKVELRKADKKPDTHHKQVWFDVVIEFQDGNVDEGGLIIKTPHQLRFLLNKIHHIRTKYKIEDRKD